MEIFLPAISHLQVKKGQSVRILCAMQLLRARSCSLEAQSSFSSAQIRSLTPQPRPPLGRYTSSYVTAPVWTCVTSYMLLWLVRGLFLRGSDFCPGMTSYLPLIFAPQASWDMLARRLLQDVSFLCSESVGKAILAGAILHFSAMVSGFWLLGMKLLCLICRPHWIHLESLILNIRLVSTLMEQPVLSSLLEVRLVRVNTEDAAGRSAMFQPAGDSCCSWELEKTRGSVLVSVAQ